jgi:transcriptional regulator with XRE-family HTH domain
MKIGRYLKQKRSELGFSDVELAKEIGITVSSLNDVEDIDENDIQYLTIQQLITMCHVLKIRPIDIYQAIISDFKKLSIQEIIKKRRDEKGLSIEKLAELIGYNSSLIESIENNENLNEFCLNFLKNIANELDLPFEFLLEKVVE